MEYYENEYGRRPELEPGETILWQGKPNKKAFATSVLVKGLLCFLWPPLWFTCITISQYAAGARSISDLIARGYLPLLVMAALPWVTWLLAVARINGKWKKSSYYITNRRTIFQSGILKNEVRHQYLDGVWIQNRIVDRMCNTVSLQIRPTYYVGRGASFSAGGTLSVRSKGRFWMEGLEDGQRPYELLREMMEKNRE